MKIDEKRILRDYNKIKSIIRGEVKAGHWDKACSYIQRAATFMYHCNVIYSDQQLEDAIGVIAKECTKTANKRSQVEKIIQFTGKRLAFYDYFTLDNRGLTEQYIDTFNRLGFSVLFIVRQKETYASKEIFKKIRANSNFSVYCTSNSNGEKLIKELYNIIDCYKPTDLLAHTSPWDVEGICACRAMEGRCIRYLSNITDHAYWLGTSAFDYFLEFRDYGCNISHNYRRISPLHDIKVPYFPIINKNIEFEGFPFSIENKKLIVSGGSIYKIKGSRKFLEIIKYILDRHADTIFLYLGNGDHQYLHDFSVKYGYQDRFFHLSERKDIYQIILRSTLYLNTYPLLGGLMTQISAIAGKLPLTLNDTNDHCQTVTELLTLDKSIPQIEFQDTKSLLCAIDNYLIHPELLEQAKERIQRCVPSPEAFAKMMNDVLVIHQTDLKPVNYSIDIKKFAAKYINELNAKPWWYRSFFYSRDFQMRTRFFLYYAIEFLIKLSSKCRRSVKK